MSKVETIMTLIVVFTISIAALIALVMLPMGIIPKLFVGGAIVALMVYEWIVITSNARRTVSQKEEAS